MLVFLSGISASGKGTVIAELAKQLPNLQFFKSATTRPRRENEDAYIYLTQEEFDQKVQNDEFFETEPVHGFYYGVLNKSLDMIIGQPDKIFIKDIDVHGMERIVKFLKGKAKVITIFLDAPDNVLYDRLIKRGESPERATIRLQRGQLERSYKDKYDHVIENIDLDKTVNLIKEIILKSM